MKKTFLLLSILFSIVCCAAQETYELLLPNLAPSENILQDDITFQIMQFWTHIDFLRAVKLSDQEKMLFLPSFVNRAISIHRLFHQQDVRDNEYVCTVYDLIKCTLQAFDDLYDLLNTDEIGCVRVLLRKVLQRFEFSSS